MDSISTGEGNSSDLDGHHGAIGQGGTRVTVLWQVLGALLLLAMAVIHLYLVFAGVGGVLGVLFVFTAIAGLILTTLVVESVGVIVLAVTAALAFRTRRSG